ncbi:MAG: sodium:solute symporter family protein [Planctomycetota bacterium]
MDEQVWTFIIVGASFALYIGIALWSRAGTTGEFYVAGKGVPPLANGMATAADWMSAASFIGMAGLISLVGYDGSVYLMGWTGGYVLLALLLAPYLRKFGKFTVPDFVGDRYYSSFARVVAVVCAIFISFTYVAGQMRGVGVVFSRFLEIDITLGVIIGMCIVFFYAVLGGMKGITYTQVAQYCVLIFAFTVPAIFISILLTNNPVPQLGFGGQLAGDVGSRIASGETIGLLQKLDGLHEELGFAPYTDGSKSTLDVLCITLALMVGTAGLPHVIVRFYTVPSVQGARVSAFWALLLIALLYTAAPAVGAFARTNLIDVVTDAPYSAEGSTGEDDRAIPDWFRKWETTGLLAWVDKNGDGRVQYVGDTENPGSPGSFPPFVGKPDFVAGPDDVDGSGNRLGRGLHGERLVKNEPTTNNNELFVDPDIMVLANPEIARLPAWVIGLVAAGGLAAALSTAAGLLLVVSTAISHDLCKMTLTPNMPEKTELWVARGAAAVAVFGAGLLGIYPPDYVAATVAFAFGLAASSFFPAIILGIFVKRANREGVVCGMIAGIGFTAAYILAFKFTVFDGLMQSVLGWDAAGGQSKSELYLLGITPEGIGAVGMLVNFVVAFVVSFMTREPPQEVQDLVERIRLPDEPGDAHEMQVPPAGGGH